MEKALNEIILRSNLGEIPLSPLTSNGPKEAIVRRAAVQDPLPASRGRRARREAGLPVPGVAHEAVLAELAAVAGGVAGAEAEAARSVAYPRRDVRVSVALPE